MRLLIIALVALVGIKAVANESIDVQSEVMSRANGGFTMEQGNSTREKFQTSAFVYTCTAQTLCPSGQTIYCWAQGFQCSAEYYPGRYVRCAAWGGPNGYNEFYYECPWY